MVRPRAKAYFLLHEVVVLTGFTKYMLDYLAREDIVRPSSQVPQGRGRRRQYLYGDVVVLRALRAICERGGGVRNLRDSLRALRAEFGELRPGQRLDKVLFVEGNELCLRTGAEGGRQLRTGQMTLGFFVDLRAVSAELAEVVSLDKSGQRVLDRRIATQAEAVRREIWESARLRRAAQ